MTGEKSTILAICERCGVPRPEDDEARHWSEFHGYDDEDHTVCPACDPVMRAPTTTGFRFDVGQHVMVKAGWNCLHPDMTFEGDVIYDSEYGAMLDWDGAHIHIGHSWLESEMEYQDRCLRGLRDLIR